MRVLLVNDFYAPHMVGGAETLIEDLAGGLVARGHEVAVVTARIGDLPAQDVVAGIPIFRIGGFPAFERARLLASGTAPGHLTATTIADFQAAAAAFQPDVVHFHNIWLLGPQMVHHAGVRRGLTLHDYWPICVRRTMIRVNWQPCNGPGPIACRLCRLRAPATWRSLDLVNIEHERDSHAQALRACDFVTTPSRYLADQIERVNGCRMRVVYNGIKPDAAAPPTTSAYVLFGSRPVSAKGYDVALRAFKRPELRAYELYVAGNTAPAGAQNVRVLGQQPSSRMPELIAGARCVIVPSLWPENCPMIILEALRAGVPVVASRIGGIPELIEDGVTGLLVPPGDGDALAAAIRRCADDQQLRAAARQAGPMAVHNRFSRDVMIAQFEELYAA